MVRLQIIASRRVLFTAPDAAYTVAPGAIAVAGGRVVRAASFTEGTGEQHPSFEAWLQEFISTAHSQNGQFGEDGQRTSHPLPPIDVQDFGSRVVAPAFVNAHTHLAMSFFRGLEVETRTAGNVVEDLFFALESKLTADDVRAFSRMGAYECVLSGTGLVWDHYYEGRAVAEAVRDVGLCAIVAPTLQDIAGPGMNHAHQSLDDTLAIDEDTRLAQAGVFAALGPHATDTVSAALWKDILATARARSLPVHCHVAQSADEVARAQARAGCGPVGLLRAAGALDGDVPLLAVHCVYMGADDVRALRKAGATLVSCPHSQLIFAFPADIGLWDAEGASWCVATDCAASNDSMNVQKELRFVSGWPRAAISHGAEAEALGLRGGPTEVAAVEARRRAGQAQADTFSNAEFLLRKVLTIPGNIHPKIKAGGFTPGALANVAVWDMDHPAAWPPTSPLRTLAMADAAPALHNLMCAGRWLGQSGAFAESIVSSQAYQEARAEATARLNALLVR